MFLSNPAKSFLASLLVLSSTAGCGLFTSTENNANSTVEEPKSRIPFRTKEPENFQCEIIETAGETVRRKRLSKKGNWRRVDFDYGETTHRTLLQTDKEYLIDPRRGTYAETTPGTGGEFSELTHELLNTLHRAEFEETAREGRTVRYRVRPRDSGASEIVIRYDESIGMPVKQEFFSIEGEARMLRLTVELVDFKNEPDANVFSIPPGYRKVPMSELLKG